jgi:WD40 repeat protein
MRQLDSYGDEIPSSLVTFNHEDKTLLASGATDRDGSTMRIWDPLSGKCIKKINAGRSMIFCLIPFTEKEGKTLLACGSADGIIRIWDPMQGVCIRTFEQTNATNGIQIPITCLATFKNAEDKQLFISGSKRDADICIWDYTSGLCIQKLKGHEGPITCLTILNDQQKKPLLLSGSWDKTMRIWDLTTGLCIKKVQGNDTLSCISPVNDPQNKLLIAFGSWDATLSIWNPTDHTFIQTTRIKSSAFSNLIGLTDLQGRQSLICGARDSAGICSYGPGEFEQTALEHQTGEESLRVSNNENTNEMGTTDSKEATKKN